MATISTTGTQIALDDILAEGTDGQYLDITLTDAVGTPIDTAALVSITGTLRAVDTETAIFASANLVSTGRATYPGAAGVVRVTFSAADLAASGTRALQTRELALTIVHSGTLVFRCWVRFRVWNGAELS